MRLVEYENRNGDTEIGQDLICSCSKLCKKIRSASINKIVIINDVLDESDEDVLYSIRGWLGL